MTQLDSDDVRGSESLLTINLYSWLGCPRVRAPKGLNLTARRAVEAS